MIRVDFPEPSFRTKKENGRAYIFDPLRKTWCLLTEEEWVRQNFIAFLTQTLQYPSPMIAVEREMKLNGMKKRFDLMVFGNDHQPLMLIECKEPKVKLSEDVLQQVLRYNLKFPCRYLVITNGDNTIAWENTGAELKMMETFPSWEQIVKP